ncbi:Hypothetical protein A7982_08087 [Minicystis rosea]|nr:Hypothetical protein A7982_08087 [Minicystis rosea]
MRRFALVVWVPAALAFGGCHQGDASDRAPSSATPPASSAAPPASAAAPPVSAARPAARAPFEVVDLFDLLHHGVSRFAYCKSTRELFVSFSQPPGEAKGKADVVYQWNVPEARLVHAYTLEKGWMADELFPSPDGRLLVVRLYRTEDRTSSHWGKHALLDTVKHQRIAGDLRPHDDRFAEVAFGTSGERLRISTVVYDRSGRPSTAAPSEFPPREKGKLWVIESSKSTLSTHGLYYTDAGGKDHLLTQNHWHDNYGLTRDGAYVVTTTWDGEILAFSTADEREVFRQKLANQYGYLAQDDEADRFLIADATSTGTSHLRALVRTR